MSVIDFVHLGSSISLRSFARVGASLSVCSFTYLGSSLSVRSVMRAGGRFSTYDSTMLGIHDRRIAITIHA
jgi:hypothetical protein